MELAAGLFAGAVVLVAVIYWNVRRAITAPLPPKPKAPGPFGARMED